jgi:hypothetical protein
MPGPAAIVRPAAAPWQGMLSSKTPEVVPMPRFSVDEFETVVSSVPAANRDFRRALAP